MTNRQRIEQACQKLNLEMCSLEWEKIYLYNECIEDFTTEIPFTGRWILKLKNGKTFITDVELPADEAVTGLISILEAKYEKLKGE